MNKSLIYQSGAECEALRKNAIEQHSGLVGPTEIYIQYERERHHALVEVLKELNFTLRKPELATWRATIKSSGYIPGCEIAGELTIRATDGIIGLFQQVATGHLFRGHIQFFTGRVQGLVPKPRSLNNYTDDSERERLRAKARKRAKENKMQQVRVHRKNLANRTSSDIEKIKQMLRNEL